jgi:hypothetical protein
VIAFRRGRTSCSGWKKDVYGSSRGQKRRKAKERFNKKTEREGIWKRSDCHPAKKQDHLSFACSKSKKKKKKAWYRNPFQPFVVVSR